jgi:hypothetical protein
VVSAERPYEGLREHLWHGGGWLLRALARIHLQRVLAYLLRFRLVAHRSPVASEFAGRHNAHSCRPEKRKVGGSIPPLTTRSL